MRPTYVATAAVAVLFAFALPLTAQDEPAKPAPTPTSNKLPMNVFAKSKAGDWAVWTGSLKVEGQEPQALAMDRTIDSVEGTKVTTTYHESMSENPKTEVFETKDLTLEAFLESDPAKRPALKDVKFEDAKKKVGDKEFTCKKATFTNTEDGMEMKGTLWLTDEVPAGGVVAMEVTIKGQGGSMTFNWDLAGMGPKGKTEWGKSIEEVNKATKK